MFGSNILEVVIGLVFIYLLYSLLASTINEGIAAIFALRARMLEKAIGRMLDDGMNQPHSIWGIIIQILKRVLEFLRDTFLFLFPFTRVKVKNELLVDKFYNHPGIKYLGENRHYKKPSYISPEYFSKALTDILQEMGNGDIPLSKIATGIAAIDDADETKKFIQSLFIDSNNDVSVFRTLLEDWFKETMNRTSGWYKKQSQDIILIIGLLIAVAFNVDTFTIVTKLSRDKEARKSMADMAANYAQSHKDSNGHLAFSDSVKAGRLFDSAETMINKDINSANALIALGWDIPIYIDSTYKSCDISGYKSDIHSCNNCVPMLKKPNEVIVLTRFQKLQFVYCMATNSSKKMLGFLITAFAISLGAPFWFDILGKVVQLRSGGKKPDGSMQK